MTPDSLTIAENTNHFTDSDSLKIEEEIVNPAEQRRNLEQSLAALQAELMVNQERIAALDEIINRYEREIIPLALFSQACVYQKIPDGNEKIQVLYNRMCEEYPNNKYTRALENMLAGKPIRLIDPREEEQYLLLDKAFGYADTYPDSMLVILNELVNSDYPEIKLKANFRLGWYYTFEASDTTAAKPYLAKVLEYGADSDYITVISKFFDGKQFQLNRFDQLLLSFAESDSLKENLLQETEIKDSTKVLEEESNLPISEKKEEQETINMSGTLENYFFPQPESPGEQGKENQFFIPHKKP
jgi:hypothetical protein